MERAATRFEQTFKTFGLPQAIRWITACHSRPATRSTAHPARQPQTGATSGLHLTLQREATKPASANVLQQQSRFDAFVDRYNRERPHQALDMKLPADVYVRSPRVYRGHEELS